MLVWKLSKNSFRALFMARKIFFCRRIGYTLYIRGFFGHEKFFSVISLVSCLIFESVLRLGSYFILSCACFLCLLFYRTLCMCLCIDVVQSTYWNWNYIFLYSSVQIVYNGDVFESEMQGNMCQCFPQLLNIILNYADARLTRRANILIRIELHVVETFAQHIRTFDVRLCTVHMFKPTVHLCGNSQMKLICLNIMFISISIERRRGRESGRVSVCLWTTIRIKKTYST